MSRAVVQSEKLASLFKLETVPIRFSDSISDIGSMGLSKISRLFSTACRLFKKCICNRPDLVYVTLTPTGNAFFRDLIFVGIIKLFNLPRLFHLHGKGIKNEVSSSLKKRLYRWAFRGSQVILLYPRHYEDIKPIHNREDCYILPNGIEDAWHHRDPKQKIVNAPPNILFFSNMVRSKGPLELLKALTIVKALGMVFRARFAGEWSSEVFRERFYGMVREHGLESRVTYIGPKYGSEKEELLTSADIFVLPTFNETFPLVILEAMSFGLPVIATHEGGIPDIVMEGRTGFLVPKMDPEALAGRLALLIEDGELRMKLGRAGRKRFEENFTMKVFEDNLVKVFNQCLIKATPQRFHARARRKVDMSNYCDGTRSQAFTEKRGAERKRGL